MKKVFVVAAHPDDEVLGCGGTLLKHIDQGDKVYILFVTDYSNKSLKILKKKNKSNNIWIKCISMDDIPSFLKSKKIKFDKIISSYALYYSKNPIKVISKCSKFLEKNGKFLITAPCYPHTLTEFASHQKTLPKIAKKYIDFSSKNIEVYLKKKKINKRIFNFKNFLKFRGR